ncbi:MAG: cysteate synthase [Clostridiaceae bacterium]|jgi:cysteate synthase|nr:cysteate synthase [Clostridiaceae bacterium]
MTQTYQVRCLGTGDLLQDDGFLLANPASSKPALIRAEYARRQLTVRPENPGIFRFADWLPVGRTLPGQGYPVTYRSEKLAQELGLERLYITFSGYWPEIGATMSTGTFKECEAYAVCARYPRASRRILVVASAGNTARAFLKVASENRIPLVVVVPRMSLGELWQDKPLNPWVKILVSDHNSDYFDAIQLADELCGQDGFQPEGGAKNIARRDGMGTTVLSAVTTIGEIPDVYYQAIGSGTGAIAAYEANLRLLQDGRFGDTVMSLRLAQNKPFLPIYNAWQKKSRDIEAYTAEEARSLSSQLVAKVLANRKPPYGPVGGLFDALSATNGQVLAVSNDEAKAAQELFAASEGCDICPESGVALAALQQERASGQLGRSKLVMLNVTGGGLSNIERDLKPGPVAADAAIDPDRATQADKRAVFDRLRNEILNALG